MNDAADTHLRLPSLDILELSSLSGSKVVLEIKSKEAWKPARSTSGRGKRQNAHLVAVRSQLTRLDVLAGRWDAGLRLSHARITQDEEGPDAVVADGDEDSTLR